MEVDRIVPFDNFTAKLNGIAHEYASVDKHPYVLTVAAGGLEPP
jgi:hypothetical protein